MDSTKNSIGFTELKRWLKHRHPMIYIDRVINYIPGKLIEGLVNISGTLDCIAGHFPERAIYPGSNLVQAFSQCAIILFQLSTSPLNEDELTVVGSINVRFFKIIVPGDSVILKLNLDKLYKNDSFYNGAAYVNSQRVAAIKLSISRVKISSLGEMLW